MNIPDYLHQTAADILASELRHAERKSLWAVVLGLIPKQDGNAFFVLYGKDLQDGIAGFGATPEAAIYDFEKAMGALSPKQLRIEASK
jgi:hypothetical protein